MRLFPIDATQRGLESSFQCAKFGRIAIPQFFHLQITCLAGGLGESDAKFTLAFAGLGVHL